MNAINNIACRNSCSYSNSKAMHGFRCYAIPTTQLAGYSQGVINCDTNTPKLKRTFLSASIAIVNFNNNAVRSNQFSSASNVVIIINSKNVIPENASGGVSVTDDSYFIESSQDIESGRFVNVFDDNGIKKIRKADRMLGYEAHGYILEAVNIGVAVKVYFEGNNDQASFFGDGVVFLGEEGFGSAVHGNGAIAQKIGVATSDNNINFEPGIKTIRSY